MVAGILMLAWIPQALPFDPIVLYLLRALRDRVAMSVARAAFESAQQPGSAARAPIVLPAPPSVEEETRQLRALIDDSFRYLDSEQRAEVHKSLVQVLADPKNAPVRAQAIAEFRRTADAVRKAYERLDRLSDEEKRRIASELGEALATVSTEEREQIETLVREGELPVPPDLNAMILAELKESR